MSQEDDELQRAIALSLAEANQPRLLREESFDTQISRAIELSKNAHEHIRSIHQNTPLINQNVFQLPSRQIDNHRPLPVAEVIDLEDDDDDDDIAAAIELSILESQQEIQLLDGNDEEDKLSDNGSDEGANQDELLEQATKVTELPIPTAELYQLFFDSKIYLEVQYGVKLAFPQIKNKKVISKSGFKIIISSKDEVATLIASQCLQERIDQPVLLTTALNKLAEERVHIFIDQSNIFIAAQYIPKVQKHRHSGQIKDQRIEWERDASVRISPEGLHNLVSSHRNVLERVVFGSIQKSNTNSSAAIQQKWKSNWEDLSYKICLSERNKGQAEMFVDDALIAQIEHSLLSYPSPPHPAHVLVLLTGDGNENYGRASFLKVVSLALLHGWKVELWTWRCSMSKKYLEIDDSYSGADRFKIVYLDEYRDTVTYKSTYTPHAGHLGDAGAGSKAPHNGNHLTGKQPAVGAPGGGYPPPKKYKSYKVTAENHFQHHNHHQHQPDYHHGKAKVFVHHAHKPLVDGYGGPGYHGKAQHGPGHGPGYGQGYGGKK